MLAHFKCSLSLSLWSSTIKWRNSWKLLGRYQLYKSMHLWKWASSFLKHPINVFFYCIFVINLNPFHSLFLSIFLYLCQFHCFPLVKAHLMGKQCAIAFIYIYMCILPIKNPFIHRCNKLTLNGTLHGIPPISNDETMQSRQNELARQREREWQWQWQR